MSSMVNICSIVLYTRIRAYTRYTVAHSGTALVFSEFGSENRHFTRRKRETQGKHKVTQCVILHTPS